MEKNRTKPNENELSAIQRKLSAAPKNTGFSIFIFNLINAMKKSVNAA